MAERLVVVSDMWGAKKGLWITSYLGYLQQYFDIVFYDCQQLANLDLRLYTEENVHKAFVNGGIDTAVAHLLRKESVPSHYLAFSTGGTIAWKAGLQGVPMKSLYAISATRVRYETIRPSGKVELMYGDRDENRPSGEWAKKLGCEMELIEGFGHTLYSDEKIIRKVCQDLLATVTHKVRETKKAV
ncbi:hypothetical protein [Kriegella aquimaris]|uniref:Alpha/beta hydrolase n=1 Tax=Kriegella aquimaris TaxID=192904 RepID=A0A1G9VQV2_9FLAO|nr:hypothetical protein [Kriegella aquimaris]SDM74602.1 hypothetical protein SAMN04488514_11419 [Kriegella aquimaris]